MVLWAEGNHYQISILHSSSSGLQAAEPLSEASFDALIYMPTRQHRSRVGLLAPKLLKLLEAPFACPLERLCTHHRLNELLLEPLTNNLSHGGLHPGYVSVGIGPSVHHIREHPKIGIDQQ